MSKLIIVSHRLPYTCSIDKGQVQLKPSVGGLATGLMPLLQQNAVWIGWHGYTQRLSKAEAKQIDRELAERHCRALPLPVEKQKVFYNDVANGIIWPLYHYHADHLPMHLAGWETYEEINRLYADFICQHTEPGDVVWIHDYHLQVLPQMLRERHLKVKIGFFLHIPFPSYEIFRILPWREEILEGILGADLVGFHTNSYGQYFRDAVEKILGLESSEEGIVLDKRHVEIDAFPLGVDFQQWAQLANSDASSILASSLQNLKAEHPFHRFLLSVDRLDYTKGLPRKLLAFERLLEQHQELRGLVSLVQIAPPSRDAVAAYGRYRKQVEELVGRINGRYGLPGYQPVQYIARSFSSEEISLLYPITDVMVVTPLRDGMNLVAKEFIASRADEDGVLVLSELAGAAAELTEALQVNPFDIDKTAAVFFEAVTMDGEERRMRMRAMRAKIKNFDTHSWAETFIERLQQIEEKIEEFDYMLPKDLALALFEKQQRLTIFIDYETALSGSSDLDEASAPDSQTKMLLTRLAHLEQCEVHLLSDRSKNELAQWFGPGPAPLYLHSECGAWTTAPKSEEAHSDLLSQPGLEEYLNKATQIFEDYARRTPGLLLQKKAASVMCYYRLTELTRGERAIQRLRELLASQIPLDSFDIIAGKRFLELRLKDAKKDRVVAERAKVQQPFEHLLLIGDDLDRSLNSLGDEVARDSTSVLIGARQSRSPALRLRSSEALLEMLRYLELFLSSGNRSNISSRKSSSQKAEGISFMPLL